jgi:cytochrome P450
MAALRADPSLIGPAMEELFRYDGPIEIGIVRFTTSEIDIGGTVVPGGGEAVLLSLAGADRDPYRFPDTDRIDIHRRDPGHLAFGHGIHFCLGAPLARMEGAVALGALLRRCPDLALAVDPADLPWRHNPHLRGLEHLPVTFTPTMEAGA